MMTDRTVSGLDWCNYCTIYRPIICLWLSRQRELFADAHSANVTKNPLPLARALVKISYNLNPQRDINPTMSSFYISSGGAVSNKLVDALNLDDREGLKEAIEKEEKGSLLGIFSTHPPTATRLKALLLKDN